MTATVKIALELFLKNFCSYRGPRLVGKGYVLCEFEIFPLISISAVHLLCEVGQLGGVFYEYRRGLRISEWILRVTCTERRNGLPVPDISFRIDIRFTARKRT